ncbi:hypothetical protein MHBO_001323 [Bonamia ostreae]|uniref:Uncharacterized protein n=1 Tax=Bonamia ostreae TaxID=126728 RepID=A0ABV2AIJ5_9EUKA
MKMVENNKTIKNNNKKLKQKNKKSQIEKFVQKIEETTNEQLFHKINIQMLKGRKRKNWIKKRMVELGVKRKKIKIPYKNLKKIAKNRKRKIKN